MPVPAAAASPVAAKIAQVPPAPNTPLPEVTRESLEASIRHGVDFLVGYQNKNGSWGGPTRTKGLNIYAPVPGAHPAFRAGASGLAPAGRVRRFHRFSFGQFPHYRQPVFLGAGETVQHDDQRAAARFQVSPVVVADAQLVHAGAGQPALACELRIQHPLGHGRRHAHRGQRQAERYSQR